MDSGNTGTKVKNECVKLDALIVFTSSKRILSTMIICIGIERIDKLSRVFYIQNDMGMSQLYLKHEAFLLALIFQ